jgi:hypothetical protein
MKLFNFCTLGPHKKSHTNSFEWVGTRWVLNDSRKGCKCFLLVLLCVLMLGCATNKENQELNRKVEILQKGYGELLGENRMYRRMFKTALQESYERHLKNKEK